MSSTDRIEKQILLKAPRQRVWQALSNAEEFGDWFGVKLKGQAFAVGEYTNGYITYPGYEHVLFTALVVKLEPPHTMALRWHPYAVDTAKDYSGEATTLIEFTLTEVDGGTLLKLVESGFDALPEDRRLEAWRMNSGGWDAQIVNIEKHLDAHP